LQPDTRLSPDKIESPPVVPRDDEDVFSFFFSVDSPSLSFVWVARPQIGGRLAALFVTLVELPRSRYKSFLSKDQK